MQLIKEIRQRSRTVDNIVNVCLCQGLYIPEDVVNFLLDIGDQIDVVYNRDLEDLLAVMNHDSEHKAVIGVEKLLIEEEDRV